ncbi:MAG TPA: YggT family protein [Pyrinomonadaceae bacterium]|nr:YggT family protein [Pyrinomonadaceae bacterium]
MDIIFQRLSEFVWYLIATVILVVIALMLARLILNKADLNPFSRPVIFIRRWSDPLVNPVRRPLVQMGFSPNVAPLVTILIAILMGFFASRFLNTVLFTVHGLIKSATRGAPISFVGFLIYGALAFLSLLIFMRIVVSWGASSTNRLLHFLIRLTEPVLAPFRRIIPPLGMLDISPIIVLLLLDLLQLAVATTLLR